MDIYFDTKFTDFVTDSALISIGFVSVDGKEYRTNRLVRSGRFAMNLILEKQEAENEDDDLV